MTTDKPRDERPIGEEAEEPTGPVVHDRRRIDPVTGEVRPGVTSGAPAPAAEQAAAGTEAGAVEPETGGRHRADQAEPGDVAELRQQVAERTADLQRLQAEFLNYKRRVERDRQGIRESAVAGVLTDLLPVLDDIGRAREHGELEGGFKAVAEALESTLNKLGLVRYGAAGDPFDPHVHEALMHTYSDQVTVVSTSAVLQPGYRMGERVLRPARVAVAEPTESLPEGAADAAEGAGGAAPGSAPPAAEGAGPAGPEPGSGSDLGATAGTPEDDTSSASGRSGESGPEDGAGAPEPGEPRSGQG